MSVHRIAGGDFTIGQTPFQDSDAIDYASIGKMTDFFCEVGSVGITVLGVMGEAPKLTSDEAIEVADFRAGSDTVADVRNAGICAGSYPGAGHVRVLLSE